MKPAGSRTVHRSLPPLVLLVCLLLSACAEPESGGCSETATQALRWGSAETTLQALTVSDVGFDRVEPDRLVPGTVVRLLGTNLAGESGTLTEVELDGTFTATLGAPNPLKASLTTAVDDDGELTILVDQAFQAALGAVEGSFQGSISIRVYVGAPPQPVEIAAPWSFELLTTLVPDLIGFNFGSSDVYPGDAVPVDGDGLLLPGEGTTEVTIEGTFAFEDGSGTVEYVGGSALRGNLKVAPDRRGGTLLLTEDVFPPTPGIMQDATVSLSTTLTGGLRQEAPATVPATIRMNKPFISGFSPEAPGRGEKVIVEGRGFLPDPKTLFQLNGKFHPDRGEPRDVTALLVAPDRWIDGGHVEMGMLTQTAADGSLTGLSAQPGKLQGTVTPFLYPKNGAEIDGLPWQDGFRVGPTRQMVWIRYLPTFVDTLQALFGLGPVERDVRARVADVTSRDYADFNVEFVEDRPDHFVEYSIIEVGGPDPNSLGLFGLDNTMGKDTENIRLDDVVAGANSESANEGYPAFGGVFVESFIGFSPQSAEPLPVANDRFDQIFEPFAPFLCGEPVTAAEAIGQGRGGIGEAVRVFGSIIGNTVVHEIGHSLGLTQAVAGKTQFHNLGDNGNIMDAGTDRSFFERSELDGEGPSGWHEANRAYLQKILPKPSANKP